MKLFFLLVQTMSVFLVVAYLYCKSPWFKPLTTVTLKTRDWICLYFFFSAISMMGTYLGLPVHGALANTRAIGPVLAGIIGGPVLGSAVGFTGGLHRYFFGGFTALSCGLSTTVEGLIGGMVHLYLFRKDRGEQIFHPSAVFLTTIFAECVQMGIILLVSRPYDEAIGLVRIIALPMIATSSTGAALFMSIIRDQKNIYEKAAAISSARALRIAERTLSILAKGFNRETARDIAQIIHQETDVGAVAITDTEKVLAFVGDGSDHHLPGSPISSDLTRKAIEENTVIFADGLQERYVCTLSDACALNSVLVVPLKADNDVVGTIKLYELRKKRFLNMNKSLGEGIAALLSNQILLSRYQEQKSLLLRSELKLLQAQVNPHFLFNCLNTIIAIVRKDSDRARELLIHLSNYFRKNLKRSSDFSTLEEELDHVNSYLKIEKARFEDRLAVEMEIDPSLLGLKIPTFTLQPLIENAIKHGISNMLEQGVTRIRAFRVQEEALIEIEDNAGNFNLAGVEDGLGIKIVDKRIKHLFGSGFGTEVKCIPQEMTRITIRVPVEAAAALGGRADVES